MYQYETHLHTSPVSKCAHASVRENLEFYKSMGYAGVFITNHFFGSNDFPTYAQQVEYHFSDYEQALELGKQLDIQVLSGIEIGYQGTDFLIYGLDKDWYLQNEAIMQMSVRDKLYHLQQAGALVIHAHPFREADYIDHIRLYPWDVHGVEVYNACRTDLENQMAKIYAENYQLLPFSGSDNHRAGIQQKLGGIAFSTPLADEKDFVSRVKAGEGTLLTINR